MASVCGPVQYAVVSYVRNELGKFVEALRRELHPPQAHLPTHITVLPPRPLEGSVEEAVAMLREASAAVSPFQVELGEVTSFLPTTPTVFLRVVHWGYKMRELHDLLNRKPLAFEEALPYMPHVTVAKLDDNKHAAEVLKTSKERWVSYRGSHEFAVERLSFVRGSAHNWTDLAEVNLAANNR
jgi:2'-5' RNA ligase